MYLASRSKRGVKIVTVLQSESIITSRLTDLPSLKLPKQWETNIAAIVSEHRMLYEPWVETAKDYNELRGRLAGRGYTNLPTGVFPLLRTPAYGLSPAADTSSCDVRKTMIRKRK